MLAGFLSVAAGACSAAVAPPPGPADGAATARLQELISAREGEAGAANYVIHRGDTVHVRVQQMEELNGDFRVSEQGNVILPLVGSIAFAGMTERQAAEKLGGALRVFIKDPQVAVGVNEIHGSQVSIMGAVARPGVYPIRGLHQSIADVVTLAGGITKDGGSEIYLTPASGGSGAVGETAESDPAPPTSAAVFATAQPKALTIDLKPLYQGRNVPELNMPVRPGDMIVVPAAGDVYVDGWVEHPGSFRLSPGMTVSQAVSSAGGMHFAAARGRVTVQRKSATGENRSYPVDYQSITSGQAPDVFLESGDRVDVGSNPLKVVPWGIYSFLKTAVTFGIGGNQTLGAK